MQAKARYFGEVDLNDDGYLIQTFMNDNETGGSLDDWNSPDHWGDGKSGTGITEQMVLTCSGSCAAYANFWRRECPETYNYKGKGGVTIYHPYTPEIDLDYSTVSTVECKNNNDAGPDGPLEDDQDGSGCGDYTNPCTPILVELGRGGVPLSGLDDPVYFDLDDDTWIETVSWTEREAKVAFLVYDRDGDGVIGSGRELFGAFTPQPASTDPNGYRALAVFDQEESGGNGDGWISAEDRVFADLRLWIDRDHDAVSQADELFTLPEFQVEAIELDYVEHRRRDRHGNEFRYSSLLRFEDGRTNRSVDVVLLSQPGAE